MDRIAKSKKSRLLQNAAFRAAEPLIQNATLAGSASKEEFSNGSHVQAIDVLRFLNGPNGKPQQPISKQIEK